MRWSVRRSEPSHRLSHHRTFRTLGRTNRTNRTNRTYCTLLNLVQPCYRSVGLLRERGDEILRLHAPRHAHALPRPERQEFRAPLFRGMSPVLLGRLVDGCTLIPVETDEVICREGETGRALRMTGQLRVQFRKRQTRR